MLSKTVLFEGPHRAGKGTSVELICKRTSYAHTLIDRGWASAWAFAVLYKREQIDLDRAIQDYFANPTACVVLFELGQDDFELDCANDAADKEKWVGLVKDYSNRELDALIKQAVGRAEQSGYGARVLKLTAREQEPGLQAEAILSWLETVY